MVYRLERTIGFFDDQGPRRGMKGVVSGFVLGHPVTLVRDLSEKVTQGI